MTKTRLRILEALDPINSGMGQPTLLYRAIDAADIEEMAKVRPRSAELLLTSQKLVMSDDGDRDALADRFTEISTQLYGAPEEAEVVRLLANEYALLLQLEGREGISQEPRSLLLDTYQPIVEGSNVLLGKRAEEVSEREAIKLYQDVLARLYGSLFSLVDEAATTEFDPDDLHKLFTRAIQWLADNDDPDWAAWTAELRDTASLSVSPGARKLLIANRREPVSIREAKSLLVHELLVHALRSKNGYKTGDARFALGIRGYTRAEEGLGILAETAMSGELPDKAYDRYIDVALALGIADGRQRTRQELFEISYARQYVRAELRGEAFRADALISKAWAHVDRIYRGGRGDSAGGRQAIFTRDIVYYAGYKQMLAYVVGQLEAGKAAEEVWSYLSQAKFDPLNIEHVALLHGVKSTS